MKSRLSITAKSEGELTDSLKVASAEAEAQRNRADALEAQLTALRSGGEAGLEETCQAQLSETTQRLIECEKQLAVTKR